MKLSSLQLAAFAETAKTLNFSKAAMNLCITQSALSQRIQKLEARLGDALFLRTAKRVQLTHMGERLLRYCSTQAALEQEFLAQTELADHNRLVGTVRVAGFSTIMSSVILPHLALLCREHPEIDLELHSMEMKALLPALESGLVDFIVTGEEICRPSVRIMTIGFEHYVLTCSASLPAPNDVFLDHDKEDPITASFWRQQTSQPRSWRTYYLDDIHMIIAGVKNGLGRAVLPLHLVKNDETITVLDDFTPLKVPVYLACYKNEWQTRLQRVLWQRLQCAGNPLEGCVR
ncbi:LysR family transcriptional regulator [Legionella spiritensis]|uniref:LysR family transcriptional regulator n=1 Tax=Legionella spiritensis TaxID=452 RepID=UPI000F6FF12D|nr:LysR family transcriptional regulator [Legionella spiritensis]VEG90858.1 LysR family transcriptional regulator [Legionella spiritensis]